VKLKLLFNNNTDLWELFNFEDCPRGCSGIIIANFTHKEINEILQEYLEKPKFQVHKDLLEERKLWEGDI